MNYKTMGDHEPKFSKSVWILKDIKKKNSIDVIKIISRIDEVPVLFDFSAGQILVIRYSVETYDGLLNLYIPSINSFIKKLKVGTFFELGSRRCYNYENNNKICDWIIYVNRIKNLTPINLKIGERLAWNAHPKSKIIDFPFDETWLDKSLPIKNNLDDCSTFFDNLEDIDSDTLLSIPLKILRLKEGQKIEVLEPTGSIIKNIEFMALNHNNKLVRLYVPYFLKDLVKTISERLNNYFIIINRLKIFFKKTPDATYAGFLWDPTLSGFVYKDKGDSDKVLSSAQGEDIFGKLDGHSLIEIIVKDFKSTEERVQKFRQRSSSNQKKDVYNKQPLKEIKEKKLEKPKKKDFNFDYEDEHEYE